MAKAIKQAKTQLERDASLPQEKTTDWRRASTSLTGVIRTSSHAGSKPGYNHFGGSKGTNIGKAVTRTARANRGRMGGLPTPRKAVYKKDARKRREAAELRQQLATEQKANT